MPHLDENTPGSPVIDGGVGEGIGERVPGGKFLVQRECRFSGRSPFA